MRDRDMPPVLLMNGGRGTRLGKLTTDRPKCLVKVAGRPFIDWQLEWLHDEGVQRIVICTGYRSDQISQHVAGGARFGVQVIYSDDGPKILGTARSITKALRQLDDDVVFVLYGDTLPRCSLYEVEQAFFDNPEKLLLMTVSDDQYGNVTGERYAKTCSTGQYTDAGLLIGMSESLTVCGLHRDMEETWHDLSVRGEMTTFNVPPPFDMGTPNGLQTLSEVLIHA